MFQNCGSGLCYYNTNPNNEQTVSLYSDKLTFFSTVAANKACFTRAKVEGANRARILQGKLGWPSTADFKSYVARNLLVNCSCTVDDSNRADAIYGSLELILQGKVVRQRPQHYASLQRVPLPPYIRDHHKNDDLDLVFLISTTYLSYTQNPEKLILYPCSDSIVAGRKKLPQESIPSRTPY